MTRRAKIKINKVYISWEDYGILLQKLVRKLKKDKALYTGVFGIPRGGWPIAVMIAHHLNIPLIKQNVRPGVLVVDDISDEGNTLLKYKDCTIACLHSTKWTKVKPDYFVSWKKSKLDWLVYPYEVGD